MHKPQESQVLLDRTPPSARRTRARVRRTCVICTRPFLIVPRIADRYTTCSRSCSSIRREQAKRIYPGTIICERCGNETKRTTYMQRFCSNACRLAALNALPRKRLEGPFSHTLTPRGYVRVYIWDGDEKRAVMEHRFVMEQYLGRRLTAEERVHHIDGDRANNDLLNLRLYASQAEHLRDAH